MALPITHAMTTAAGQMPSVALLAAIAAQILAELSPVPECRRAGLGLGGEPALTRADLALARLTGLLVGEPALDVTLAHEWPYVVRAASPIRVVGRELDEVYDERIHPPRYVASDATV